MASIMLRPTVVSFLDVITEVGEELLELEDVIVCKKSELLGLTLKEARIPEKTGLIILALRNQGEDQLVFNPGPEEVLEEGDTMMVLGKVHQIDQLRQMACDVR
ncbi:cation:proton antiporter regulatory subunit [Natranaerobius thermophilus]|uniref:cation:proton antiporter regulatory subunit n=1 Tax=Natranaerobius thermophilus TaxID=375929 RepID=UPI0001664B52|nr:TrkA C-terminal domain-containing protein [Natranaerobius thermophilus]